jgi:NAD-dependent dihydropyrimidine dehydrogenase PreA subunit
MEAAVAAKPDKGNVAIDVNECKGCGLCVRACKPAVLRLDTHLNRYGYHTAVYDGKGCNGCGLCFFACPEPGAITVWRRPGPVSAN